MRIDAVEVWREHLPLSKPYTISRETISDVELFFVRIHAGELSGAGCASPAVEVTGESPTDCHAALDAAADLLAGKDSRAIGNLARQLERELPATPAARAACDMAMWDLLGKHLGTPVVDLLGRAHEALPTSVTIGIQSTGAAVALARESVAQGFRALKVKLGRDVDDDADRLRQIRAAVGPAIALRTDPNAGYDGAELRRYLSATRDLALEFCEQPVMRGAEAALSELPVSKRARLAADESILGLTDAGGLLDEPRPYGIFNLKLMKCGGISPARRIAHLAEATGIELMWGCNDESRISIAAALHVALASPATRYLDLDGSFDLARDLATGGFVLEKGLLRTAPGAGLGVHWEVGDGSARKRTDRAQRPAEVVPPIANPGAQR
ncbi:MAG: dipeptide epimerase [Thermoanaerobaculia bacterium]